MKNILLTISFFCLLASTAFAEKESSEKKNQSENSAQSDAQSKQTTHPGDSAQGVDRFIESVAENAVNDRNYGQDIGDR